MRREQGAALHAIEQRIGDIEDELREWRCFDPSDD
jgi:hypothetical protein